jgi:hypothetical protein
MQGSEKEHPMPSSSLKQMKSLLIISQDPGVFEAPDRILTTQVDVPVESILPGLRGHRIQVIDYDCHQKKFFEGLDYATDSEGFIIDPFVGMSSKELVEDWHFHCQNAYAVAMRTLSLFERALGRRANWEGNSHQLKLVPHAFSYANAFYYPAGEAILLGYYPAENHKKTIYTCLSHDVIVHETTHALLDGLRSRFIYPSSPDQAAFHEGFADIVALLSVFALPGTVKPLLKKLIQNRGTGPGMISLEDIQPDRLKETALFGMADEMGKEDTRSGRAEALRRSVRLKPDPSLYQTDPEFKQPHRRGEILVAAVMNTFIQVWSARLETLHDQSSDTLNLDRVEEEGKDIAEYLLLMAIRAMDYTPPMHLEFKDYLSALITIDKAIHPNDTRYDFRQKLLQSFTDYGIRAAIGKAVSRHEDAILGEPGSRETTNPKEKEAHYKPNEDGSFRPAHSLDLSYEGVHFESLTRDPNEVFHFIWTNRQALGLDRGLGKDAYWQVLSVRPCVRVSLDGFVLKETVAEFYQVVRLTVGELRKMKCNLPEDMPEDLVIPLYGGGTLIFNEFGRLEYYIHNSLVKKWQQEERIASQWRLGGFSEQGEHGVNFATTHRLRAKANGIPTQEGW